MADRLRRDERSQKLSQAGARGGKGTKPTEPPKSWESGPPIKTGERPKPKRRLLKLFLGGTVVVALLLVVGLIFLPTLASGPVRGIAEREIGDRINGSVEITTLRLGWTGAQSVGPVTIKDQAGDTVARVDVTIEQGLLGLARMDLGEIRVDGEARVVRDAGGLTNIEKVFEPMLAKSDGGGGSGGSGDSPDEAGGLPEGLRGRLVLDAISLRFVDEALAGTPVGVVAIEDAKGEATLEPGQPIKFTLDAEAMTAPTEAKLSTEGASAGEVAIDVTLTDLFASNGAMTPERVVVNADIIASELSMAAADAIAGLEGRLVEAMGETATVAINATGPASNLTAKFNMQSEGATAQGGLQYDGSVLTQSAPMSAELRTQRLLALAPELRTAALEGESARLSALPNVALNVEELRLPIDLAKLTPETMDLRGGAFAVSVQAEALQGQAVMPGGGEQAFSTDPIELRVESSDLADAVRLTLNTAAQVAGNAAGVVQADVTANGLLTDAGAVRTGGPESVEGLVLIDELATAVLQPFADASGLDLGRDIGPALTAQLNGTASFGDGGVPDTDVSFEIAAEHLTAVGAATVREGVLSVGGTGEGEITARLARVGPALNSVLVDRGVNITRGGPAEVRLRSATVDLNKAGAGDLRGAAGHVMLAIGAVSGAMQVDTGTAFALSPTRVEVSTNDLAGDVRVVAAPTTQSGQPAPRGDAGRISADMTLSGLLDGAGKPAGAPGALAGQVRLDGVPTAIAQPFLGDSPVNLVRDVGPVLTLTLDAQVRGGGSAPGGSVQAGAIPETDLEFSAEAAELRAGGSLRLGPDAIRVVGDGVTLKATRGGAIAAGFVPSEGPIAGIEGAGPVTAAISSAHIPMSAGKPDVMRMRVDAQASVGAMRVLVLPPAPKGDGPPSSKVRLPMPVEVSSLSLVAQRAQGSAPSAKIDGAMSFENRAFTLAADLEAPGLMERLGSGQGLAPDPSILPVGTVTLTDVPTRLVKLAGIELQGAGERAVDVAALTERVAGPGLTVTVAAERPQANDYRLRNEITSTTLNVKAPVVVRADRIEFGTSVLTARVEPATADLLIDVFAPAMREATAQPLGLANAMVAQLRTKPVRVPLTDEFALDVDRLEGERFDAEFTVNGSTTPIVLRGDGANGVGGLNIGPATLDGVKLGVSGPTAALVPGGSAGSVALSLDGRIAGRAAGGNGESTLASLDGSLSQRMFEAQPAGPLTGSLKLGDLSTGLADVFAGSPGLVSGALGPTAALELLLDAQQGGEDVMVRANVTSQHFQTTKPLRLDQQRDRLTLAEPLLANWTMTPAWADRFVLGLEGDATEDAPRFTAPTVWTLDVRELSIGRGEGKGPLDPNVFKLQSMLTAPKLALTSSGQPLDIESLSAEVRSDKEPGRVDTLVKVQRIAGEAASQAEPFVRAWVQNLADANGVLTPDAAVVTGKATIQAFPTGILDALAKQDGLLGEMLGSTISLKAEADKFGKNGGVLNLNTYSPRASATLRGRVVDGVLRTTPESTQIRINEITRQFSQRLTKGVPIAAEFEKTTGDEPGEVFAPQIFLPMDGDVTKLNGVVVLNPGTLQFQTTSLFRSVLDIANQKQQGVVGRKLKPLTVAVTNGVIRYGHTKKEGRYSLPIGEFDVELEGIIDLPQKKLDMIVWIPAAGVADETLGVFGLGNIGNVGKATLMPFRVRGPFDDPGRPKADLELFAKEGGANLIDGLIKDNIEDVGKGLGDLLDGEDGPLKDILPR